MLAPVRIAPSPERAGDSETDAEADPGAIEIGRRRDEHRQIIVIRPPPVDLGRVVHRNIDHRPIYRLDSDNGLSLEIRSCGVDLSWPASTLRGNASVDEAEHPVGMCVPGHRLTPSIAQPVKARHGFSTR